MSTNNRQKHQRRGAVAAEMALIMIPLIMMLFGIVEYGRLLMCWDLLNNAAREGCRYAVVNNTSTTVNASVTTVVTNRMVKQNANFTGFTVSASGTHAGVATAINNLSAGDPITVTVSGKFNFMNIIPLVHMPPLTISSSVTMICEDAT